VLRCIGFDNDAETPVTPNSNGWPNNFGITPGTATTAVRDTSVKASGNSSIKFTVPGLSGSNAGGNFCKRLRRSQHDLRRERHLLRAVASTV
jgi:hypothetical protein